MAKHIVLSSTGKDSEAAMWWAYHNLPYNDWEVIFSDLDWDHSDVYDHLEYLESRTGKIFKRIKSNFFDDKISEFVQQRIIEIFGKDNVFAKMIMYKARFPSTKARFCTEELKVKPVIDYILDFCHYDLVLIQGVRAEESEARRNLKPTDDYFKFYLEPYGYDKKGNPKFHTYRKKEVLAHLEKYDVTVLRPILKKTHNEVFNIIFENDSPGNKLYRAGMSRVGCFPCIMCRLSEIRMIAKYHPEKIDQIYELEILSKSTFFSAGFIPTKFCSKTAMVRIYREDLIKVFKNKKIKTNESQIQILGGGQTVDPEQGLYNIYFKNSKIAVYLDENEKEYIVRRVKVPTIKDVAKYVLDNPNQTEFLNNAPGCVSVYNICESTNN